MDKSSLRKSALEMLKAMTFGKREEIEKQLHENLFSSQLWKQAKVIGVTVSGGVEWNTCPVIRRGWEEGKVVAVPKCLPAKKALQFYELNSFAELEVVYYNLKEPVPELTRPIHKARIELLVVPGLLFNRAGYRIGFGGGYYDRFLVDFPNKTVSLCTKEQIVENLPIEPYDKPVQHLITERGFLK